MKKLILIGMMAGLGFNLMAQASMEESDVDTVTIGSKVAYSVDPSIAPDALMDASKYNWFFTTNADANLAWGAAENIRLEEDTLGNGNLFDEDSLNVSFEIAAGLAAGTTIKVKVQEVSQPKFGQGCSGSIEEQQIFFVARPSFDFANTQRTGGGCDVDLDTVDISLSVDGYGPFVVSFTINGGAVQTQTLGDASIRGTNIPLTLRLNQDDHLTGGVGSYVVAFTNIADRFTAKSLDQTRIASQAGEFPADSYTIGINPSPTTQPIKHIRNL
jgi:hypothetical protein